MMPDGFAFFFQKTVDAIELFFEPVLRTIYGLNNARQPILFKSRFNIVASCDKGRNPIRSSYRFPLRIHRMQKLRLFDVPQPAFLNLVCVTLGGLFALVPVCGDQTGYSESRIECRQVICLKSEKCRKLPVKPKTADNHNYTEQENALWGALLFSGGDFFEDAHCGVFLENRINLLDCVFDYCRSWNSEQSGDHGNEQRISSVNIGADDNFILVRLIKVDGRVKSCAQRLHPVISSCKAKEERVFHLCGVFADRQYVPSNRHKTKGGVESKWSGESRVINSHPNMGLSGGTECGPL
jgi:hypothetical protein